MYETYNNSELNFLEKLSRNIYKRQNASNYATLLIS